MASIDKMLTAAAHLSMELGEEKSAPMLKAFAAVEAATKELHAEMVKLWKAELGAGRALSPATAQLIQKALK